MRANLQGAAAAAKAASAAAAADDSDDEVIDLDEEEERKRVERENKTKAPPARPPASAAATAAQKAANAAAAANVAAVLGEESSPALARALSRLGAMPLPPGARAVPQAQAQGAGLVRSHSSLGLPPASPPTSEENKDSHRVLTIGYLPNWEEADLFRALETHGIGSVVDARPAAAQASIAVCRKTCSSKSMTYDWQPMLSNEQENPAKKAVTMRLAAQGRGVAMGGRKPCILFSGGSWRLDPARRGVAKELESKNIEVYHISYCGQYLERHKEVSSAEVAQAEKAAPGIAAASARSAPGGASSLGGAKAPPTAKASMVRGPEMLVKAADKVPEIPSLQTVVIPPKDDAHRGTLIYLHPFKSSPMRYLDEAQVFAQKGVRLVFPNAPILPITALGGKEESSWFDYTTDNRGMAEDGISEPTLAAIRARLADLIEKEAALLGDGGHARLMIGGAAQGCSAALDAMLRHSTPLAGFAGVCGHPLMCTPLKSSSRHSCQFFVCQDDKVVRWMWAQRSIERLNMHQKVTVHGPFSGLGHITDVDPVAEADWMRIACGRGLSLTGTFEPKADYKKYSLIKEVAPVVPASVVPAAKAQALPAAPPTAKTQAMPSAPSAKAQIPSGAPTPPSSAPPPSLGPRPKIGVSSAAPKPGAKVASAASEAVLADRLMAQLQAENEREIEALQKAQDSSMLPPRSKMASAPPTAKVSASTISSGLAG